MNRQRGWSLFLLLIAGCSTHPIVDFCDYVKPGKIGPVTVQPYGGVAIPQGPIVPVAPTFPTPGFPAPPGAGVIPGPAPLPGNLPPGDVQLQPPAPVPPPPPPPPGNFGR